MNGKKLKDLFRTENKKLKTDVIALMLLGVLLIVLGNSLFSGRQNDQKNQLALVQENQETVPTVQADRQNIETQLEKRLEAIFSKVSGAGEVDVMVRTKSSAEQIIAQDTKSEANNTDEMATEGDQRVIDSQVVESTAVILEQADGSSQPLIIKELEPEIEGVVIVAQGGDNIAVKDALSKAAQALLNVPAHKVEVLKMK